MTAIMKSAGSLPYPEYVIGAGVLDYTGARDAIIESTDAIAIAQQSKAEKTLVLASDTDDNLYEQLIKTSQLWYYREKFGCRYSVKIEEQINQFNKI